VPRTREPWLDAHGHDDELECRARDGMLNRRMHDLNHMSMSVNRQLLVSCAAGALGGCLLTCAILALVVSGGGLGSSKETVTVRETQIVRSGVSDLGRVVDASEIYARDAPGVVFVSASGVSQARSPSEFLKGEGGEQGIATGSGFEIDGDGTILTNWHVVDGARSVRVGFDDGRTVDARVIGKDPSEDLAVLRVPVGGLVVHPLTLGDSSRVQVGDPALAIGNPFGLQRTLTTGVISASERQIQAPNGATITGALQTDAPINPGNSGGPLLNETGEVIGINSQIETGGEHAGNVGIAFAIPIDTVKSELSTLEGGGTPHGG
jgi:S1-C subfamily serine protease